MSEALRLEERINKYIQNERKRQERSKTLDRELHSLREERVNELLEISRGLYKKFQANQEIIERIRGLFRGLPPQDRDYLLDRLRSEEEREESVREMLYRNLGFEKREKNLEGELISSGLSSIEAILGYLIREKFDRNKIYSSKSIFKRVKEFVEEEKFLIRLWENNKKETVNYLSNTLHKKAFYKLKIFDKELYAVRTDWLDAYDNEGVISTYNFIRYSSTHCPRCRSVSLRPVPRSLLKALMWVSYFGIIGVVTSWLWTSILSYEFSTPVGLLSGWIGSSLGGLLYSSEKGKWECKKCGEEFHLGAKHILKISTRKRRNKLRYPR